MSFDIDDKVRVTLESDRYYNCEGVIKRASLEAHPHQYYLVTFDDSSEGEWYQVDLLELAKPITEHEHDTAQAVIEAARAVLKHVSIAIITHAQQNYLEVSAWAGATHCLQLYEESVDEFPDTFLGNIAVLSIALEAHDEATIEPD